MSRGKGVNEEETKIKVGLVERCKLRMQDTLGEATRCSFYNEFSHLFMLAVKVTMTMTAIPNREEKTIKRINTDNGSNSNYKAGWVGKCPNNI